MFPYMTCAEASIVPDRWLDTVVSVGAFLFFALMLSVPRGYTVGTVILFGASLYYLSRKPKLNLSREDKALAWLLTAMFAIGLFTYAYHRDPLRSLDLPTRYLLAIPILLLVLKHPPRIEWLRAGWIVGCTTGAGVALWQMQEEGLQRAFGTTGAIQFGNSGLMMGVFCAAGLFGVVGRCRRAWAWRVALAIGMFCGLYTSIASGSRGGWVVLPAIIAVFFTAFVHKRCIVRAIVAVVVLVGSVVGAVSSVPNIQTRYQQAVKDMRLYQHGNVNTSIGARLAIWNVTLTLIAKKPLLGWSEQDYKAEQKQLVNKNLAPPVVLHLANTHNNYLEYWAFQGLGALVALIALLIGTVVYFGRELRSNNRPSQILAICGVSLIVGYSIFCMSQIMLGRNNTLLFFLVSLILLWGAANSFRVQSDSSLKK